MPSNCNDLATVPKKTPPTAVRAAAAIRKPIWAAGTVNTVAPVSGLDNEKPTVPSTSCGLKRVVMANDKKNKRLPRLIFIVICSKGQDRHLLVEP